MGGIEGSEWGVGQAGSSHRPEDPGGQGGPIRVHFHGLMWMQVHLLVWSAGVSVGSEACICLREPCRHLREEGTGALRWEQKGDGCSVRRGKAFGVCSGEMFYQHHSGYWVENWLGDTSRSRETS